MENPKDHIYVLLADDMYEWQWRPLEREVGRQFELADCEVKSNWRRNTSACAKDSTFRNALHPEDIEDIAGAYFRQVAEHKAVILAAVIDKRSLYDEATSLLMHQKAYE